MRRDARQEAEFLQMLSSCERILLRVCLCFARRTPDDIRDLYQEIACTLWEAWPRFRGESSPTTWATAIALRVAGQEVRHRKHIPRFVEYDERIHSLIADEATDLRFRRLYQLIDSLDDDDDRKLVFLYLDRHPIREIARMTGTTEAAVKQRLYRVRQKLISIHQQDSDYE